MGTTATTPKITVPKLPRVSYHDIELFVMTHTAGPDGWKSWQHEHIGQLARLVSDLRSDAEFLEQLAKQVDELLMEAIDDDRDRDVARKA